MLKTACCCLSLRTGNLIIGWIHMITGVITSLAITACLFMLDKLKPEDFNAEATKEDVKLALFIALAVMSVSPTMAGTHLYGTYKYRKGFLIPYLVFGALQILSILASAIYSMVLLQPMSVVGQIIGLLIAGYFYLITWSFYKEIRDGLQPPPPPQNEGIQTISISEL